MTTKDELHQLVDQLDEETARVALALLQDLRLPRALRAAPIDDEPVTDEDLAEIEAARAEARRGEGRPWEDVRQELAGGG
jgi:hypothetical protein